MYERNSEVQKQMAEKKKQESLESNRERVKVFHEVCCYWTSAKDVDFRCKKWLANIILDALVTMFTAVASDYQEFF